MSPSRRAERRGAVFLLYQKDLTGGDFGSLFDAYERDNGEHVTEFVRAQAEGAWADRDRLDASIDAAAEGWSAERMAVLERNILRLAVWEIGRGEVPVAVAIDEAVSLAKRYASPEAATLVNGVLGKIARDQGIGTIDQTRLQEVAGELERLRVDLERDDLTPEQAVELLERMTVVVHDAVEALEARVESLEDERSALMIEPYLIELRLSREPGLDVAMRYPLAGGGKRIRPRLCLAAARAGGADPATALPAAAADRAHPHLLARPRRPAGARRRR